MRRRAGSRPGSDGALRRSGPKPGPAGPAGRRPGPPRLPASGSNRATPSRQPAAALPARVKLPPEPVSRRRRPPARPAPRPGRRRTPPEPRKPRPSAPGQFRRPPFGAAGCKHLSAWALTSHRPCLTPRGTAGILTAFCTRIRGFPLLSSHRQPDPPPEAGVRVSSNVYVEDLGQFTGTSVTVRGWLYNKRHSGKLYFLLVRDGTGIVQTVVSRKDVDESTWQACEDAAQESAVTVTGTVREDARAPGGYELTVSRVDLTSGSAEYPITPKEHGTDFLMDHRHLWIRSSRQHAILKIRHELVAAIRDFLNGRGFTLIDAPIFTPNACEGTTTLFETEYFGQKAYLTQSGQLYMEAAAMAFGKVYCFGPTFRAEKSKTRRHLTEFWMVEPEVAWADLDDNMRLIEDFVSGIVARVLDRRREELKRLERDTSLLEKVAPPFPRVHYNEAVEELRGGGIDFGWGGDFGGG